MLGPLLFLIYVNDIDMTSYVPSDIRLFADDAYLYCTTESMADPFTLQEDLTALQEWETLWKGNSTHRNASISASQTKSNQLNLFIQSITRTLRRYQMPNILPWGDFKQKA